MKYGIYFAYWTKEWFADYKKYMDKISGLGFDVMEISCAALRDVYTTKEQLIDLREYAKEKNLTLTAGYGPTKAENLCSEDPEAVKRAMSFFRDLLPKLQLMDIKILGGGLYSYWPVDFTLNNDKEGDRARAVKNLKELSKTAEECDVTLGMEVLNRYEGYILNTCEEAIDFVDEIGSSHVNHAGYLSYEYRRGQYSGGDPQSGEEAGTLASGRTEPDGSWKRKPSLERNRTGSERH